MSEKVLQMNKHKLHIFDSKDDLLDALVEKFHHLAQQSIAQHGRFMVSLSGGSTPIPFYERLAKPEESGLIDWSRVYVFIGDERCVPLDHPDSNYKMICQTVLSKVPIPEKNYFPLHAPDVDPKAAALAYEETIKKEFGQALPVFDLMFMGLGPDGHTASLFPDTPALSETRRLVTENFAPSQKMWRITMTLPLINNSEHIIFMVEGHDKAKVLKLVTEPGSELPAQLVRSKERPIEWFIDQEAAAEIEKK